MPASLIEILHEIRLLEPIPTVATRVLRLTASDEVVPNELVDVIQLDPALTGRVLALCNSSYFGLRATVGALTDAGNLLGTTALVNIVLTSCTGRFFRDFGRGSTPSQLSLWERSVASALAARSIAESVDGVEPHRAYTTALLQDLGQLVIDRFVVREAGALASAVARGTPLLEAEAECFNLHHAEIGARLAAHWQFPAELVDTIRYHHTPEHAQEAPLLAAVVHLAEGLADSISPGSDWAVEGYATSAAAMVLTGFDEETLESLAADLLGELERARAFVSAT